MNKKGFTLVEIIAVIVLLGVIIVLAVPATMTIRKTILQREDAEQINSIEAAAVYYAQDENISSGSICVKDLLSNGYLDPTIPYDGGVNCTETDGCLLRPTDNELLNEKTITITKPNNKTSATYNADGVCSE